MKLITKKLKSTKKRKLVNRLKPHSSRSNNHTSSESPVRRHQSSREYISKSLIQKDKYSSNAPSEQLKQRKKLSPKLKSNVVSLIKQCERAIALYKSMLNTAHDRYSADRDCLDINLVNTVNHAEEWLEANLILKDSLCSSLENNFNVEENILELHDILLNIIQETKASSIKQEAKLKKSVTRGDHNSSTIISSTLVRLKTRLEAVNAVTREVEALFKHLKASNKIRARA